MAEHVKDDEPEEVMESPHPAVKPKEVAPPPAEEEAMETAPEDEEPAVEKAPLDVPEPEEQGAEKGAAAAAESGPMEVEPEPAQEDDKPKAPLTYAQTVSYHEQASLGPLSIRIYELKICLFCSNHRSLSLLYGLWMSRLGLKGVGILTNGLRRPGLMNATPVAHCPTRLSHHPAAEAAGEGGRDARRTCAGGRCGEGACAGPGSCGGCTASACISPDTTRTLRRGARLC